MTMAVTTEVERSRTFAASPAVAGRWALVAATAAIVVVELASILTLDGADLAGRYTADDGFYYFELARHFPTPTFNAGITTTGFHPLWWVLLAPVFEVLSGFAAVRAALVLAVALHALAGWLIHAAVRRRVGPWPAVAAGVLWIVHPLTRTISLSGVEAPLVACLLAGLMLACSAPATARRVLVVGGLVGASYLARTDSPLVTVPVAAMWLVPGADGVRGALRRAWPAAAVAAAVAAPWAAYLATHGGLQSDSSRALAILREEMGWFGSTPDVVGGFVGRFVTRLGWPAQGLPLIDGMFGLLVAVALVLVCAVLRPRLAATEWALLAGVAAVHVAQAALLGDMREWYAVYLLVGIFVVVIPRLAAALDQVRLRAVWVAAALILAVLPVLELYPQERDKVEAVESLAVAAGVGAFNTGIYQYVADADILNLDGVMNPTVHDALEDRALCGYLREHDIRFVLDNAETGRGLARLAPGARIARETTLVEGDLGRRQVLYELELDC